MSTTHAHAVAPRALALCALVVALNASGQPHEFPGRDWDKDPWRLSAEVRRRVDDCVRSMDTSSLMIVRGGKVAYEYGDTAMLSYLASARKSVLSMLYGKYVESGAIDLGKTLADLEMDDVGGLLPIELRAKVVDLISARSGVYHPASNGGDLLDVAPARGSKEPGSYWLYSNWDFNAAGAAFEQMTGKTIFEALRDDVAIPIGMQDFAIERQEMSGDRRASQYLAYHMFLSTRDMARLAYLMLRKGDWNGTQVIPASWVARSTSVVSPRSEMKPDWQRNLPFGYGYMWWVWDEPVRTPALRGAYTSNGAFGQYFTVVPALDMVIAHKTVPVNRGVIADQYLNLVLLAVGMEPASETIVPVLLREGGEGEEAAYALATKLLASPGDRIANHYDMDAAACTLLRAGKAADALKVFALDDRLFGSSSPNDRARARYGLARAYEAIGDRQAAAEAARAVLRCNAGFRLADVLLARLGETVRGHQPIALDEQEAGTLIGRYRLPSGRVEVTGEKQSLLVQVYGGDELMREIVVFPEGPMRYFVPESGDVVSFERADEDLRLTVTQANGAWSAVRSP